MGDSIQGSYTEHCKWHHNSQYVGYDTEFFYKIADDVLTITYKKHPETNETWIRVVSQQNNVIELDEPIETSRFNKAEKAYFRDKKTNANTQFQLAGIWKYGNLALKLRNTYDFLQFKKD